MYIRNMHDWLLVTAVSVLVAMTVWCSMLYFGAVPVLTVLVIALGVTTLTRDLERGTR